MLQAPIPGAIGGVVEPLPSVVDPGTNSGSSSLLVPSKEVFQPSSSIPVALKHLSSIRRVQKNQWRS